MYIMSRAREYDSMNLSGPRMHFCNIIRESIVRKFLTYLVAFTKLDWTFLSTIIFDVPKKPEVKIEYN